MYSLINYFLNTANLNIPTKAKQFGHIGNVSSKLGIYLTCSGVELALVLNFDQLF